MASAEGKIETMLPYPTRNMILYASVLMSDGARLRSASRKCDNWGGRLKDEVQHRGNAFGGGTLWAKNTSS
jgi:hypothetical protein